MNNCHLILLKQRMMKDRNASSDLLTLPGYAHTDFDLQMIPKTVWGGFLRTPPTPGSDELPIIAETLQVPCDHGVNKRRMLLPLRETMKEGPERGQQVTPHYK